MARTVPDRVKQEEVPEGVTLVLLGHWGGLPRRGPGPARATVRAVPTTGRDRAELLDLHVQHRARSIVLVTLVAVQRSPVIRSTSTGHVVATPNGASPQPAQACRGRVGLEGSGRCGVETVTGGPVRCMNR